MPPSTSRSDQDLAGAILVVEDDPDVATLISYAFKQHDVDAPVHTFHHGKEVIDLLHGTDRDTAPALVLLDLKLPQVDGLQVLRALRGDERTKRVPIVIFTSSAEPSDVETCYAEGANSYIQKPVDYDKFSDVLAKVADYWLSVDEGVERADGPGR